MSLRFAYLVLVTPGTRYNVNAALSIARISLTVGSFFKGESCGKRIFPKRYKVIAPKINIQSPMNTSLFSKPQCITRSALDKNFSAIASSRKPNTTFTVVSHPPDLGRAFNQLGNMANNANGSASANPNPAIPLVSCIAPPLLDNDPANRDPRIGPVQLNDTRARVSAMKNIPLRLPTFDLLSAV